DGILARFHQRNVRGDRSYLLEQGKPFAAHGGFVRGEPGDVAPRMREIADEAVADWVAASRKDNRYPRGRTLHLDCDRRRGCQDDIRLPAHHLGCICLFVLVRTNEGDLDLDVAAFCPPELGQCLPECCDLLLAFIAAFDETACQYADT